MSEDSKRSLVFWFTAFSTVVTCLALSALVIAQTYVRWKLNQNFTFLGEAGIPSLAALLLGQILALVYSLKK
jgi:hypothetical protein